MLRALSMSARAAALHAVILAGTDKQELVKSADGVTEAGGLVAVLIAGLGVVAVEGFGFGGSVEVGAGGRGAVVLFSSEVDCTGVADVGAGAGAEREPVLLAASAVGVVGAGRV